MWCPFMVCLDSLVFGIEVLRRIIPAFAEVVPDLQRDRELVLTFPSSPSIMPFLKSLNNLVYFN